MNEQAKALIEFVISEDRVHPKRWHQFYKIISKQYPDVPKPLILGGSIASDLAKRTVLLKQIHTIQVDQKLLLRADRFLRGEPISAWYRAPDPLSNKGSYGDEDVPPLIHLSLLP
ncbi:hypothetical protein [Aliiroseovarius sediminis]|uniref:hypothetical protein n=1 Tax=Aliiroseovarius sediminis TaxID=2925839 RepID=UPI001F55ABBD|nr:hypothetical protein [Aliiroseovarius sediminis]MCI2395008.1 hypothetical protein [Aliiroseovarius sediminis]